MGLGDGQGMRGEGEKWSIIGADCGSASNSCLDLERDANRQHSTWEIKRKLQPLLLFPFFLVEGVLVRLRPKEICDCDPFLGKDPRKG